MLRRDVSVEEAGTLDVDAAVVIDVLRAFTTAPWLFSRGAARVLLAACDADALSYVAAHPGALALKDGEPTPGFELINSPAVVSELTLTARTVVQKTTNGTMGAFAVRHVPLILCASLATASATARALREAGARSVGYVISGDGGAAEEDLACADLVHATLNGEAIDVENSAERVRRSQAAGRLREWASRGHAGVRLADIDLAAQIDVFDYALAAQPTDDGLFSLVPTARIA